MPATKIKKKRQRKKRQGHVKVNFQKKSFHKINQGKTYQKTFSKETNRTKMNNKKKAAHLARAEKTGKNSGWNPIIEIERTELVIWGTSETPEVSIKKLGRTKRTRNKDIWTSDGLKER